MAGITVTDNEHGGQLAEILNLLRVQQKWTDCCIETKTGKVYVHHVVLDAVVEKFQIKSLILSESKQTFLLKDFSEHIVEIFVTYLYTGNLKLSGEVDITEFVTLCKHLEFSALFSHKEFEKYLVSENINQGSDVMSDNDTKLNVSGIHDKSEAIPYPVFLTSNQSLLASPEQRIDDIAQNKKSSTVLLHTSSTNNVDKPVHSVWSASSVRSVLEQDTNISQNNDFDTFAKSEEQSSQINIQIKQEVSCDEDFDLTSNAIRSSTHTLALTSMSDIESQNKEIAKEHTFGNNKNDSSRKTNKSNKSKRNSSSTVSNPSVPKYVKETVPVAMGTDETNFVNKVPENIESTGEVKIEQESDSNNEVIMRMVIQTEEGSIVNEGIDEHAEDGTGKHESVDKGKKIRKCEHCSFTTTWICSLYRHSKIHEENKFQCSKCPAKFQFKCQLEDHLKVRHGDGLLCNHCSKVFTSRSGLANHMKTISGVYRFTCPFCSKTFLQKQHFNGHLNSHLKSKPYECDICKKSFGYKQNLKQHKETCGKNEKPPKPPPSKYQCEECNIEFTTSQAFANHNKAKHGDTVYTCKICLKSYRWKASYYRHIKMHQ